MYSVPHFWVVSCYRPFLIACHYVTDIHLLQTIDDIPGKFLLLQEPYSWNVVYGILHLLSGISSMHAFSRLPLPLQIVVFIRWKYYCSKRLHILLLLHLWHDIWSMTNFDHFSFLLPLYCYPFAAENKSLASFVSSCFLFCATEQSSQHREVPPIELSAQYY